MRLSEKAAVCFFVPVSRCPTVSHTGARNIKCCKHGIYLSRGFATSSCFETDRDGFRPAAGFRDTLIYFLKPFDPFDLKARRTLVNFIAWTGKFSGRLF